MQALAQAKAATKGELFQATGCPDVSAHHDRQFLVLGAFGKGVLCEPLLQAGWVRHAHPWAAIVGDITVGLANPRSFDMTLFHWKAALSAARSSFVNFSDRLSALQRTLSRPGLGADAHTRLSHQVAYVAAAMKLSRPVNRPLKVVNSVADKEAATKRQWDALMHEMEFCW